jgi:seryl-tRNA synthetase
MMKDNASAAHVLDRITEIIRHALATEQEFQITNLVQELSAKTVECTEYRREAETLLAQLEACQKALERETTTIQEKNHAINSLKSKLKSSGKKGELHVTEKVQVGELYEKIGSLEHDLTVKDNHLRKKKQQMTKYVLQKICY